MRLLILGGTGFIGPHVVRYALARGHTVTLFNRGRTNADIFPQVEKLVGDRDGDLEALKGKTWNAVIDNTGYVPRIVRDSVELLRDAAPFYLFTSTLSVYRGYPEHGLDESAPLQTMPDPTSEDVSRYYGGLKALCEREVEAGYPDGALIVRPSLIVGPGDRTDRFTYWPVRIDRGGEVLAPGDPNVLVRYIDVRDLAEWCVRMVESRTTGVYNATGPRAHLSIAEMLYGIRAVTSADVSFTWVDQAFLDAQGVRPWSDLPAWQPGRGDFVGYGSISRRRAIENGLTYRSLAVTARDTLQWHGTRPAEQRDRLRAGMTSEREAEVLAAWHGKGD